MRQFKRGEIKRNRIGQFIGNSNRYRKQMQLEFLAIMIILVSIAPAREIYLLTKEVEHTVKIDVAHAQTEPTLSMRDYIIKEVSEAGIDTYNMYLLVDCESKWNPNAFNINKNKKTGAIAYCTRGANKGQVSIDRGIFEFNNCSHPEITAACADDYKCATKEFIRVVKERGWGEWSCVSQGYIKIR